MSMILRRNKRALWTEDFIQMLEQDGPEPLGLDYTDSDMRESFMKLREKINRGESIPRQPGKEVWEILVDGVVAGDISVLTQNEYVPELTIVVLPLFRKKGIARQALEQFLKHYTIRPIEAVVRVQNPYRESMDRLLRSLGFHCTDESNAYRLEGQS